METQVTASETCHDCGAMFPKPPASGGAAGYAVRRSDGARICYACADKDERSAFAAASEYVAYLSSDGKHVTTWTGGELARVTDETVRRVGFGWRTERTYLRAIAPDGTLWHGTSPGRGMYCRLRRSKVRP